MVNSSIYKIAKFSALLGLRYSQCALQSHGSNYNVQTVTMKRGYAYAEFPARRVWGDAFSGNFWNIAITRLNLEAILTKYSIVLKDCGDARWISSVVEKQNYTFKCYWIIWQYIIVDCQRHTQD